MSIRCVDYTDGKGKFEIEIDFSGLSMLDSEIKIQEEINGAGNLMTEKRLAEFDVDGAPMVIGGVKLTSKGLHNGNYETPYGHISIPRHMYQSNKGGKTYCPLNDNARIVKKTCTPKFAKTVSNKYANLASLEVIKDLEDNHSRKLARSFVQNIGDFVGSVVDSKEEIWNYQMPEINDPVSTVGISCDGANVLILKDGYREAMTGAISLYNKAGERLHSMYVALDPEHGKARFFKRMEVAISDIKQKYPDALYLGVSDGAKDLWGFLKKHTDQQILDYYHASEYLSGASHGIFPKSETKRKQWLEDAYSSLKHDPNYITDVTKEMDIANQEQLKRVDKERLESAITYFTNNASRMKYADNISKNLPIGSGVIEAACKTIVKSRLCRTGMKWKNKGIKVVLSLRAMVKTTGKWEAFWDKINKCGVPHMV